MVHVFATLCFAIVAIGSATLIWAMLIDSRPAIVAALGFAPVASTRHAVTRRIRVRSVQPAAVRSIQARRAA